MMQVQNLLSEEHQSVKIFSDCNSDKVSRLHRRTTCDNKLNNYAQCTGTYGANNHKLNYGMDD
jgi:hypothetical protein